MYTVIYNQCAIEILQTSEFEKWLKRLKDANARARINLRIRRIALTGNLGDAKPVGDGVCELRIDYGPGYRVYYAQHQDSIILLLIGGDKSSQQRDIERAKKIKSEYE